MTPMEDDDYDDEPRPRRSTLIRCSDRMCGAEDCPRCHPEFYLKDDESCE